MRDPEDGVVWKGKEPPTEPYANRFLMDVDGHTFTERFRRLLSSRNLVFKMIIFQVIPPLPTVTLLSFGLADRCHI